MSGFLFGGPYGPSFEPFQKIIKYVCFVKKPYKKYKKFEPKYNTRENAEREYRNWQLTQK
jgi:hypothetical protein